MIDSSDIHPLDQPISRRTAKRSLLLCGMVTGIVLAILVIATSYQLWQANKTTAALCVLRADLQSRVDTGQRFLDRHPRGIQGISASDIRGSISNQRQTVRALRGLSCPPIPAP
jgi:hypothetical protein